LLLPMLLLLAATATARAYNGLYCIHGLNDDASAFNGLRAWAAAAHPGQVVEVYDGKEGPLSFEGLDALVQDAEMRSAAFCRGGCTLVGHSQGGLIARAIAQRRRTNATGLVSLAAPQQGVCAIPPEWRPAWLPKRAREDLTALLYTSWAQNRLSVAGYWSDPEAAGFRTRLRALNAEPGGPLSHLRVAAFAGSDSDEVLRPWQTSLWGEPRAGGGCAEVTNATGLLWGLHERLHLIHARALRHGAWLRAEALNLLEPLLR